MTTTSQPTEATGVLPPLPLPDRLTAFFWAATARHELAVLRCVNGHYVHYPRLLCDRCQSQELAPAVVSGRGTLYSYTWAQQAFHPYWVDKIPYLVAVVELDEQPGLRITSTVVDRAPEDLVVGLPLEVVFEDLPGGVTLPLFRPAAGVGAGL